MRAVVCTGYGPPEVLRLAEVPKPQPKRDEVCIRIFATAVTASDCIVRASSLGFPYNVVMRAAVGFSRPRNAILGLVLAGEVESAGEDVTKFRPGTSVCAFTAFRFGAYAEYECLREDAVIALKPSNVTYEEAAAVPYGCLLALCFLKKADIETRRSVLVYGASGAIGTSAVQLARHFGAAVTGVCSTANMDLVRSLGADSVIDYTRQDFTQNGIRYDLIFNAAGRRKATLRADASLAPGGRHITVDDGTPRPRVEDLVLITGLVEAGAFRPVIDRVYPLDQIVEAHRYVDQGHKKGNVVIALPA